MRNSNHAPIQAERIRPPASQKDEPFADTTAAATPNAPLNGVESHQRTLVKLTPTQSAQQAYAIASLASDSGVWMRNNGEIRKPNSVKAVSSPVDDSTTLLKTSTILKPTSANAVASLASDSKAWMRNNGPVPKPASVEAVSSLASDSTTFLLKKSTVLTPTSANAVGSLASHSSSLLQKKSAIQKPTSANAVASLASDPTLWMPKNGAVPKPTSVQAVASLASDSATLKQDQSAVLKPISANAVASLASDPAVWMRKNGTVPKPTSVQTGASLARDSTTLMQDKSAISKLTSANAVASLASDPAVWMRKNGTVSDPTSVKAVASFAADSIKLIPDKTTISKPTSANATASDFTSLEHSKDAILEPAPAQATPSFTSEYTSWTRSKSAMLTSTDANAVASLASDFTTWMQTRVPMSKPRSVVPSKVQPNSKAVERDSLQTVSKSKSPACNKSEAPIVRPAGTFETACSSQLTVQALTLHTAEASIPSSVMKQRTPVLAPLVNCVTPDWHDLSPKLLGDVFDQLVLKSDQKSLALVNRKAYENLLPKLYNTFIVDISRFPLCMAQLIQMFDEKNRGIPFIRRVIVDVGNPAHRITPPAAFGFVSSLLIYGIPKNQLEYFSWPCEFDLNPSLSRLLWDQHRRLENIEVYERSIRERAEDAKKLLCRLNNVTSLRVCPESLDGLQYVCSILKNLLSIKSLHVDLRACVQHPPRADGKSQRIDHAAREIFRHILRVTPPSRASENLTTLILWNVDLFGSLKTWNTAVRIPRLQELELMRCPNAGRFLNFHDRFPDIVLHLRALKVEHYVEKGADGVGFVDRLDGGLYALYQSGKLQHLWLRLRGHCRLPSSTYIANMAHNLETLYLDVFPTDRLVMDEGQQFQDTNPAPPVQKLAVPKPSDPKTPAASDFAELKTYLDKILSKTTPKLRQLGIPWPTERSSPLLSILKTIDPITLVFIQTCKAYEPPNPNAKIPPSILETAIKFPSSRRLRILVTTKTGMEPQINKNFCFYRSSTCSTTGTARRVDAFVPIELRELRQREEEVDILKDCPVVFGLGGRR